MTAWLLTFLLLGFPSRADDQMKKKDGTIITGQILSVTDGQVLVNSHTSTGGFVQLPYYLTDIQSVSMAPPASMANLKDAAPSAVIAALEPLLKKYLGLPATWVTDATGKLADAYMAVKQEDRATELYQRINQVYPKDSPYQKAAIAGLAQLQLEKGQVNEALSAVQPLIDEANKDLAPAASEGEFYARAFLVYGQALEAQKKPAQALEAYLTVKTIFYQNPALAEQADQLSQKLRGQNPGLGVD